MTLFDISQKVVPKKVVLLGSPCNEEIASEPSAEPVPLEIDDAPIPAVPIPAAPWQHVERSRQLPTAVPEHLGFGADCDGDSL